MMRRVQNCALTRFKHSQCKVGVNKDLLLEWDFPTLVY